MSIFKVIDVSEHQGIIDWEKVKAAGIYGAIIRCGYGQDIINQDDKYWKQNVSECERLGIPYGVYLYSYASDATAAKGEANHVLRLMKDCKKVSFPVYIDIEEEKNKAHAVEIADTFCEIIEKAGYWTGVYANEYFFTTCLKDFWKYTKWCAKYSNNKPNVDGVEMWQYSSKGKVAGIAGNVDMNECYRDFPAEITGGSTPDPVPQPTPTPAPSPAPSSKNNLISQGQQHLNNFCGAGLSTDGILGPKTQAGVIKGFQAACNHDYKSGLKEDGIWGPKTQAAIGNHTVRLGESQYMVTAVEAALYCNGYDPKGCESPGKYGNGCKAAVEQFQKDNGLSCDGIAGKNTIYKLCRV